MRRQVRTTMTALSLAVVALGLRESVTVAHQSPTPAPAGVVAAPSRSAPRPAGTPRPPRAATSGPRPAPAQTPTSVTVNGAPADTQYGPVQVQLVIRAGRIVRADAIDYPRGSGMDQAINSQAIPLLDQATLAAQSARIDTVSGATYTSAGYTTSLQSALDAAHLR